VGASITFRVSDDGETKLLFNIRDTNNDEDVTTFADLLAWLGSPNNFIEILAVVAEILEEEKLSHLKEPIFTQIVASDVLETTITLDEDEEADGDDPCIKPSDVV